jgi:hypothetical protein
MLITKNHISAIISSPKYWRCCTLPGSALIFWTKVSMTEITLMRIKEPPYSWQESQNKNYRIMWINHPKSRKLTYSWNLFLKEWKSMLLICYNNCDSWNSRTRNHPTLFIVGPDPRTSQLLYFLYHGKLTARVVIEQRVCLLLVLLQGKFGETTGNQHFCHTVQGSTHGDLDWSISSVFDSHSLQNQLATRGSKGIRKIWQIWLENIHDRGLVHNALIKLDAPQIQNPKP